MPYKSEAQRRKFHQLEKQGKISSKTVKQWDKETGKKKLPERISPPKESGHTKHRAVFGKVRGQYQQPKKRRGTK